MPFSDIDLKGAVSDIRILVGGTRKVVTSVDSCGSVST